MTTESWLSGVLALLEGRQGEVVELAAPAHGSRCTANSATKKRLRCVTRSGLSSRQSNSRKSVRYGAIDQDVVGVFRQGGEVEVVVLFYRQGKLTARRNYNLTWQLDEDELLAEFLSQFYGRDVPVPDEVVLPFEVEGKDALAEWLTERRGRKVQCSDAATGRTSRIWLSWPTAMPGKHGRSGAAARKPGAGSSKRSCSDCSCSRLPQRMECFDISTIQGHATVASMAVIAGW